MPLQEMSKRYTDRSNEELGGVVEVKEGNPDGERASQGPVMQKTKDKAVEVVKDETDVESND